MFGMNNGADIRARAEAVPLPPSLTTVDRSGERRDDRLERRALERAIDETLTESFPASDPPSWNPGIAILKAAVGLKPSADASAPSADIVAATDASDSTDLPTGGPSGTFRRHVVSLAGAIAIALLAPLVLILVGLPLVLTVRGILELLTWLFVVVVR